MTARTRAGVILMRLAGLLCLVLVATGIAFAQEPVQIADEIVLPGHGSKTMTIRAPATPEGKIAVLHFRGRLMTESYAGHCPGVRAWVNGRELYGDRLVNKPQELEWGLGRSTLWWGRGFRLMYSPDFEGNNREDNRYYVHGGQAYTFDLDVTNLVKPGGNDVRVAHAQHERDFRQALIVDLRLEFKEPRATAVGETGPPTGELPFIAPRREPKADYRVRVTEGGGIVVSVGGREYAIESAFSHERGGWNRLTTEDQPEGEAGWSLSAEPPTAPGAAPVLHATAADYTLSRRLSSHDEFIRVEDTITNTSGHDIALLQRHETSAEGLSDLYLGGLHAYARSGTIAEPANPTTLIIFEGSQLGLMAADDVLRIHAQQYCEEGKAGIRDNDGALAAGATQTYVWEIYPSAQTGYYRMVNAIRRAHDTNFAIPGGFAFISPREPFLSMSDEELGAWLDAKNAKIAGMSITVPRYHGKYTHGTAFLLVDHTPKREFAERIRRIRPGTKVLVYFHCFISTEDEAPQKYAADAILAPDGTPRVYSEDIYPMFLPLMGNPYGQKMREYVEMILDECGADGVYWDELSQSRWQYHFGEPWDGVSADVDKETLTISRKKAAVSLITHPFREQMLHRLLDSGIPLIGNGNPRTTTMMGYHFPRFIETGSISNLVKGHLYTPIGLGDHLSETTAQHCIDGMRRHLDYASLYYFYSASIAMRHPGITGQMFPCTPMELGEGYIIAKERILTNRSGNFGWGDGSQAEVHVYGPDGREVELEYKTVERDGARYVELRLPRSHVAALVRR
jgi:hypothetical protein